MHTPPELFPHALRKLVTPAMQLAQMDYIKYKRIRPSALEPQSRPGAG